MTAAVRSNMALEAHTVVGRGELHPSSGADSPACHLAALIALGGDPLKE